MKYKNYIAIILFGLTLFTSGFYAGQKKERASLHKKLKFVIQYAILLEQENAKLNEKCKK